MCPRRATLVVWAGPLSPRLGQSGRASQRRELLSQELTGDQEQGNRVRMWGTQGQGSWRGDSRCAGASAAVVGPASSRVTQQGWGPDAAAGRGEGRGGALTSQAAAWVTHVGLSAQPCRRGQRVSCAGNGPEAGQPLGNWHPLGRLSGSRARPCHPLRQAPAPDPLRTGWV